ncbi:hypothetical protein MettiDRAFT_2893 [Methanolobus tindarius DSM 2278]|uniref:Restriction endonuclease n=1 Tax=Methanolobus tindarius DSM 2278 TaxID=1090322 RepID=W9DRI4_METTI|nr:hypothetical protein [Methanolobus tindarius]ETA69394.1 hypothetical protein MettiDRAFT_2893 [Methanolobus tindarius DSM 2278]
MNFKIFLKKPEVRDLIDSNTKMPKYKIESEIKATPLTTNFALVGLAFDYFTRFHIKRENPEIKDSIWKAEIVCNTIAGEDLQITPNHTIFYEPERFMHKRGIPTKNEYEIKCLIKHLRSAQDSYNEYLNGGNLSEKTIRSCLLLARIETAMNSKVYSDLDEIEPEDIEDLRNLIRAMPHDTFTFKDKCNIKPQLKATFLPKITEGDLILDDTLIDIKVTKTPTLTREIFRQLVAYFILYNYDGATKFTINRDLSNFSVNKMGVYFARHGIMYKFNAEDVFLPAAAKNIVVPMFNLITEDYHKSGTKKYDSDFQCYR